MTGKELGDDAIRREHGDDKVGFCSEECAVQWDAMTPEERTAKLAGR